MHEDLMAWVCATALVLDHFHSLETDALKREIRILSLEDNYRPGNFWSYIHLPSPVLIFLHSLWVSTNPDQYAHFSPPLE